MVMQYFGDGDLRNSLPNLVEDEWHNKLFVLSYVAFGLDAIHQQKLVHGDFHDGNILKHNSNKNAAAFISDLGLNQLLESFHHSSKENNVYGILPFGMMIHRKGQRCQKFVILFIIGLMV